MRSPQLSARRDAPRPASTRPGWPTRVGVALTAGVLAVAAFAGTAGAKAAAPKSARHVFLIELENEDAAATWSSASPAAYLSLTLKGQGQFLPNYYGIGHVSLGNYIAEISGQGPDQSTQTDCQTYTDFTATGTGTLGQVLGDGCVYPASAQTIADQLDAKGLTWKGYMEDMGNSPTESATCRHPAIGSPDPTQIARPGDQYAARHNPFVYFHSIIDSPRCAQQVVPLDRLTADLTSAATTPNFSFITPNLCNDGHDSTCVDGRTGGLTAADNFLKTWVPRIQASPGYKQGGVLIITFDEASVSGAAADSTSCCGQPPAPNVAQAGINGPGGGRVGTLVLSSAVTPDSVDATPYNHYSLLCGLENAFGLSHLGFAGQPGLRCVGKTTFAR
jgi:hypothetical protein